MINMRHFFCRVLLLSLLSIPALAEKITVGQLEYLGNAPDGSGEFKVTFNPPPGITHAAFISLLPTLFINGYASTFVLPDVVCCGYDFLFLTAPASGFGSPFAVGCPCDLSFVVLYAKPNTTVTTSDGQTVTLKRVSISYLRPKSGQTSLVPNRKATIYLSTV